MGTFVACSRTSASASGGSIQTTCRHLPFYGTPVDNVLAVGFDNVLVDVVAISINICRKASIKIGRY